VCVHSSSVGLLPQTSALETVQALAAVRALVAVDAVVAVLTCMRSVTSEKTTTSTDPVCFVAWRDRGTNSGLEHTVDTIDAVTAADAVNAVDVAVAVGHVCRGLRSRLRQKDGVVFAFTKLNVA
jgi:hypothetical protein